MKLLSLIFLISLSSQAYAETIARVVEVKGNAFSFMEKKSNSLKYGSKIQDLSEVMVEDGATLSLVNTHGHVFHISGGSLVKLYKGIIELKNGHIWVQSNANRKGLFNTSNSIGQYGKGQFIYSFDNISGKTQLLVLQGKVRFSNALEPKLSTKVSSGQFSLVEQNYENGLPRAPTKVGLKSYKQIKSVFANFEKLQNTEVEKSLWGQAPTQKKSRSIASVSVNPSPRPDHSKGGKSGKIITIRTFKSSASRVPASSGPMDYYQDLKKKEAWKFKPVRNKNTATIRYFGKKWGQKPQVSKTGRAKPEVGKSQSSKTPVSRIAASVGKSQFIEDLKKSDFEKSLSVESKKNKRHSNEVNNLIDELKTYKQDFKKDY